MEERENERVLETDIQSESELEMRMRNRERERCNECKYEGDEST